MRPADNPGQPQVRLFSYDYAGVIRSLGPDAAFFQKLGIRPGDTVLDANGVSGFTPMSQLFASCQLANGPPNGPNYHNVKLTILP